MQPQNHQAVQLLTISLVSSGVDAVNVAPEFGVVETRSFIRLLAELRLRGCRDEFLRLAYDSGACRKWVKPDSVASDTDRAVMAGHYIFGSDEFREIKEEADRARRRNGVTVDIYLRNAVYEALERYLADVTLRRGHVTSEPG
jgi:hypothetical protein